MAFTIVHDLLTGFANAPSGTASFYLPGTLTSIVIYGDDDGTATTNPVTLDSSGRANIWLTQLARMIVQTTGGVTVSDTIINAQADAATTNSSSAFSGATQKAVNDAALTAFGGQDFQYVPAIGVGGMTPKNWMTGVLRNVLAYASSTAPNVNDGVTPADTAIAAAIAAAVAAGGGVVFFPKGTYLVNGTIAVSSGGNISLVGVGNGAVNIKQNAANTAGITFTSSNAVAVRGMQISSVASSTAAGLTFTSCGGVNVVDVAISSFRTSLSLASSSDVYVMGDSQFTTTLGANDLAILSSATSNLRVLGGVYNGSSSNNEMKLTGSCSGTLVLGARFGGGGSGTINLDAALTGTGYTFIGNRTSGTAMFTTALAALPLSFYQYGNGQDGQTITVATGATSAAPDLSRGSEITINASSGGAGTVTVPAPVPLPFSSQRGQRWTFKFINAAGGAVTWSMNAVYKITAAIPTTDAHTVMVDFEWDVAQAKLREVGRGDTTT